MAKRDTQIQSMMTLSRWFLEHAANTVQGQILLATNSEMEPSLKKWKNKIGKLLSWKTQRINHTTNANYAKKVTSGKIIGKPINVLFD
jgi:hypothetical protein